MKQKLIDFYLDYVNNFTTVRRFADHHDMLLVDCMALISIGREYHERNVKDFSEKPKQQ